MATKDGRKTGGRTKGTPNKATRNAREAIATFVDGNSDRLQGWLDDIERRDGSMAAFKVFMELLEYHVPKLSRAEITGKDGEPVSANVYVKFGDDDTNGEDESPND